VAHLYNLRKRTGYLRQRQVWTKTRPVTIPIGERRAPAPNNQPGYLRVDSVHQGDQDGVKGVYHINAVDCVTQYEGVATCERISEAFLIPVLEALLQSFPFVIKGFHSDNGSEYINAHVAKLLNKLLIEAQTKSRSRHSNDNAQAESKNGAIVRKHLGYSHIPQRFAALVNAFCQDHLNPYVNFHRPCLFAETITDAKGRQRKRYPYKLMMTPYEKLKSMDKAEQFLKPGITFEQLDAQATAMSDNDAAQRLNDARAILFKTIFNRSKTAA
jgi:transposase InsO family protein